MECMGMTFKLPGLLRLACVLPWLAGGMSRPASAVEPPHWAFQPVRRPELPAVKNSGWSRQPPDAFILALLEAAGLQPAPPADRRTLLRRASLDLTGLPPTPAAVEAFLADPSPDAFAKIIDQLLASPHYGERQARLWLDVARYSDSKGYVYAREERFFVHAWAYRDWVVRAFNENLPWDRFLKLQIAADQIVPEGSPDLAAMGFLTGGRRFIGVTHDIIDDRIDVVTRGTMALTVQCARCHDHKFDPIPTSDYYSLYGIFHNGADQLVRVDATPRSDDFEKGLAARQKSFDEKLASRRTGAAARLRDRAGDYLAAQLELQRYPEEGFDQILQESDLIPASVRRWRDFLRTSGAAFHPIFAPWHVLSRLEPTDFPAAAEKALATLRLDHATGLNPAVAAAFATPPASMKEVAAHYGTLFLAALQEGGDTEIGNFLRDDAGPCAVPEAPLASIELFFPSNHVEELWKLQSEIDRWLIQRPEAPPYALIMKDLPPEPLPRIFRRGNPGQAMEEVPRQFLKVIAGPQRKPFTQGSGRRELAEALTAPDNPLAARVAVNRIWQQHFGRGLVRTVSDFGLRADPPSHPELLDWLAAEFTASNWDVKALHRRILLSAAWQQSSRPAPATDPENRLLSSQNRRRLDLEQLRDAMLAVSGDLETSMGGKAAELFQPANKRRSLYGTVDRQYLPGTFRTFDFACPDFLTGQRHETIVPQQSLYLLNNPFAADRARSLAKLCEGTPAPEAPGVLFRAIFQRPPTEREREMASQYLTAAAATAAGSPPAPLPTPWSYGFGHYDEDSKKVTTFTPLPHFTGTAWQGGPKLPDDTLGWAQLTAEGGHAGNDLDHAVIRRWSAPQDGTISITSSFKHGHPEGDGVSAFIVSSREGELARASLHHGEVELRYRRLEVKQGDTLDFIVHLGGSLNNDDFVFSQTLTSGDHTWESVREFTPVPSAAATMLSPLAQLAQVLLLSNEFTFAD